jgi:hypothetical protein
VSQTPKFTQNLTAGTSRQKGPKPLYTSAASVPVRPATARARQRESLVKYAQQEKIHAEDGEHQTLASSPGLTVIRTLGTLSPNKLPKGPKPPKPTHVRVGAKTDKRAEGSKWPWATGPKGPVGGFASPNRQKLSCIKFGDAQNPRGTLGPPGG